MFKTLQDCSDFVIEQREKLMKLDDAYKKMNERANYLKSLYKTADENEREKIFNETEELFNLKESLAGKLEKQTILYSTASEALCCLMQEALS